MKIVIVGAGRVGYAIAEQLLTEGHDITVVESDPERAAYISSTLDVIVVEGRANVDQLRIANVADADLLIAATTSDETNLIISSFAYHEQVPKIVTKVDEDNFIELAESYGLTTIIQPADVTAGRIVEYVRWMENSAHSSGVETLRMDADAIAMAGTHEALLQRFARERIAGIHRARREPVSRCAAQGAQAQGLRARRLDHPPRQVPRPVRQRRHRARRPRGRRHYQPWYA